MPLAQRACAKRMRQVSQARQALRQAATDRSAGLGGGALAASPGQAWVERSWRRCLASSQLPKRALHLAPVAAALQRRTAEANHRLLSAARAVMHTLGQAVSSTRYFALLTNAQGVVVDVSGRIDRHDRGAGLISRVGVDLSEASVGITAIDAAL